MIPLVSAPLEDYCSRHTMDESPLFKALAKETYASTDFPQMQVGQIEGSFLRLLVRMLKAKRVLEIGCFTGYSALAMAEGLPDDGKLITCDISPEYTAIAKKFWSQSPHGQKIELKLGSALETLNTLDGPFDFAFIDADKENYLHYWEVIVPKMRQGGVIAVDNVLWSARVLKPEAPDDHAIVAFNKRVADDSRVESVMLTVRDGMTLAWKH